MAQAQPGRTYAQIEGGAVHWIFAGEDMPEWADYLIVVDITGAAPAPSVGWGYDGLQFTAPVSPAPTFAQRVDVNTVAIQSELDRQARAKGYDDIVSACTYAAQAVGAPFQAEGAAFLKWRSDVWTHAYSVLADVEAGTTPMPTPEEAVAQMPALVLP